MAFMDCVGNSKILTKGELASLKRQYENLVKRYTDTMGDESAAIKAAEDMIKAKASQIKFKKLTTLRHAVRQKALVQELEKSGDFGKAYGNLLERVHARQRTVLQQSLYGLDEFIDKFRAKHGGFSREVDAIIPVFRELMGEKTGNREASVFARAVRKGLDTSLKRLKAAGANIGELENYIPQTHNTRLIRQVSFDEWYGYMRPRLDSERMVDWDTGLPFTEDRLRQVMKDDYTSIVTRGRSDIMKRAEEGKQTTGFGADVSERRSTNRFYIFRNADAFLEYNERFGAGNSGLYNSIIGYFAGTARDTALLEILGPKPNAMNRHMILQAEGRGISVNKRNLLNATYEVLTGRADSDTDGVDSTWWKVITGAQDLLRAGLLGAAPLSALSDSAIGMTAAKMRGVPAWKFMKEYTKYLNPANIEDRARMRQAGYILDRINGYVMTDARFVGESMSSGVTKWLAEATNRWSGLHSMTEATKMAAAAAATGEVYAVRGRPWSKLDKAMQDSFLEFGITNKEWEAIRKAKPIIDGGAGFILPNAAIQNGAPLEAINRYADWVESFQQLATGEPSAAVRAVTTGQVLGDARKGTALRAAASSFTMLKNFPISIAVSMFLPALREAGRGRPQALATLAIFGTVMGGASLQIKDLLSGKDTRDIDSPKFWLAAAMQGGGLGLFGDFLFSDYSRYGRNVWVEALGPLAGTSNDILNATWGNVQRAITGDEKNPISSTFGDLVGVSRRFTPGQGLWYSRLAVERLIYDQIDKLTDPEYSAKRLRYESTIQKDYGQKFWWRRGDTSPRRAPVVID